MFPGSSLVCIWPIGPSDPARDNSQRALSKICQDKGKETCSKVRDMCGQLRLRCMRAASFPLIIKCILEPGPGPGGGSIPWPLSRLGGQRSHQDIIPGPGGF